VLSTEGYLGKNMLNLGLTYDNHTLSFGDFFESGFGDIAFRPPDDGHQVYRVLLDMGGGLKRMEYKLARRVRGSQDSGHHDLNQYNVKVDSGHVHAAADHLYHGNHATSDRATTFTAQGIIARDQADQPLFRASLTDPGAPRPIEAQTGVSGRHHGPFKRQNGAFAEVDLGTHDTIDSGQTGKVAWYNPELEDAVPRSSGTSAPNRRYGPLRGHRRRQGNVQRYDIDLSYTQIGPHYFSAGNPYLEINRRIGRLQSERQFKETVSAAASYEYEQASASGTPTDRNTINLKGDYSLGENMPAFALNFTERLEAKYLDRTLRDRDDRYDRQRFSGLRGV